MNNREQQLKDIYEKLRKEKNGKGLLDMVVNRKIKPDERDKLGLCPFLFAIDAEMPLDIIKDLIKKGGCDIKSKCNEGDTALHYAVNLDNEELQNWLIEVGGQKIKEIENNDGMKPYDD